MKLLIDIYRLSVTILMKLCGLSQMLHETRKLKKKKNEKLRFLSQQITSVIFTQTKRKVIYTL